MSQLFTLKTVALVFVLALLPGSFAAAAEVSDLYVVETMVTDESADVRTVAFSKGLDEVFIRISGDSTVMGRLKRPSPRRFVTRFSYRPVEEPVIGDDDEVLNHILRIQYNGNLMEQYLLDNGFPVWSDHRAEVIVWLTVRDGENEYVLKDADDSLLKSALDSAFIRRGVLELWPLYDYKDRKQLKIVDIRGGFKQPLKAASTRYTRGPILAGSMSWNGEVWQSNWSLLMDKSDRYWSLVDSDYKHLIDNAVDQAADVMGSAFAINKVAEDQTLAKVLLDIEAVSSIEQYRRVEEYLTGLNVVELARPVYVDGQQVYFEVTLRSDVEDFLHLINNDAELVEVEVEVEVRQPEPQTRPGSPVTPAVQPVSAELLQRAADPVVPDMADQGQNDQQQNTLIPDGSSAQATATLPAVDPAVNTPLADSAIAVRQRQLPIYHFRLIK